MVAFQYYLNSILNTPLKNITVPCILNEITKIHDKLIKRVLTPKMHIVDNELSEELKNIYLLNRHTVKISATTH